MHGGTGIAWGHGTGRATAWRWPRAAASRQACDASRVGTVAPGRGLAPGASGRPAAASSASASVAAAYVSLLGGAFATCRAASGGGPPFVGSFAGARPPAFAGSAFLPSPFDGTPPAPPSVVANGSSGSRPACASPAACCPPCARLIAPPTGTDPIGAAAPASPDGAAVDPGGRGAPGGGCDGGALAGIRDRRAFSGGGPSGGGFCRLTAATAPARARKRAVSSVRAGGRKTRARRRAEAITRTCFRRRQSRWRTWRPLRAAQLQTPPRAATEERDCLSLLKLL